MELGMSYTPPPTPALSPVERENLILVFGIPERGVCHTGVKQHEGYGCCSLSLRERVRVREKQPFD
jgi:hypothetical protein